MKFTTFLAFFSVFLLFASGCSGTKPVADHENKEESTFSTSLESLELDIIEELEKNPPTPVKTVAVDSLLNNLSLREKIGQLFIVPANGEFINESETAYKELERMVTEFHAGGIIFFRGDIYAQAVITNKLQQLSKIPLWITQDMEYGAAMRLPDATRFPPAMGIAATTKVSNAYLAGKITAREAKALGVHQIFAPVLDVNNNPENPVINVRSFSADPNVVSDFGNAFIAGVESEHVVSTAKHFPGHGDTNMDSHLNLPVVNHNYARLDSIELAPFKSTIDYGLSSIMSAHIAFPNVSSHNGLPATLDSTILHEILMDSLNFDGVVVTDGLEMNGITSKFSPGRAVVRALHAGADIMLISPDIRTAVNEIEAAVFTGEITIERIEKSVRKVLRWKKKYGLFEQPPVDIENLSRLIARPEYKTIADRIARESVTVLKNNNDILPVRAAEFPKVMVLAVADDESGSTGSSFAREFRKYHPDVIFRVYDKRSSDKEKKEILEQAEKADLVVIGSFIFLRYLQPIQLDDDQAEFVQKIQAMKNPLAILIFYKNCPVRRLKYWPGRIAGSKRGIPHPRFSELQRSRENSLFISRACIQLAMVYNYPIPAYESIARKPQACIPTAFITLMN